MICTVQKDVLPISRVLKSREEGGGGGGGGGGGLTKGFAGGYVKAAVRASPLELSHIATLEVHCKIEVILKPALAILVHIHHSVAGSELAQDLHTTATHIIVSQR